MPIVDWWRQLNLVATDYILCMLGLTNDFYPEVHILHFNMVSCCHLQIYLSWITSIHLTSLVLLIPRSKSLSKYFSTSKKQNKSLILFIYNISTIICTALHCTEHYLITSIQNFKHY